jgi:hypothetical protein
MKTLFWAFLVTVSVIAGEKPMDTKPQLKGNGMQDTPVPQQGLLAYYPFNRDATDASGKGHHGKVNGATLTADRFGREKHAYAFNGLDQEIVIDPPPPLKGAAFSMSLWVRFDFPEEYQRWVDIGDGAAKFRDPIIGQDDGYAVRCFQLWVGEKELSLVWHRMNEYSSVWTKWPLEQGRWYHAVATYDGKEHVLFVDGKKQWGARGILKLSPTEPIRIGSKGDEQVGKRIFLAGAIDDIRFYDRVLTQAEVKTLFEEQPNDKP